MDHEKDRRGALLCTLHPLSTFESYTFVVVCSRYEGKWLLSRHCARDTWETQGGHIEKGESPLQAARRELYEESGVARADLYPVCDYFGYDHQGHATGVVFLADVHALDALPASEMAQTGLFDPLPASLTYPRVTPRLIEQAQRLLLPLGIR